MNASIPSRIGDFEILRELSSDGGQGRLFAARCLRADALPGLSEGVEVALKVLPVRGDDPEGAWRRLERRTAALVAARHDGIVRYWGCFRAEGGGLGDETHAVAMELLRGETLADRLAREPLGLDAEDALRIVRAVLEALACAEGRGIVHRDIKPSNVFLCRDGSVKLIDFELARAEADAEATLETGAVKGTWDYMAPEFHPDLQPDPDFRGDAVSDAFSVAVLLHEALTGRKPYARGAHGVDGTSMVAFFERWSRAGGHDPERSVRIDVVRCHPLRHVRDFLKKGLSVSRRGRFASLGEALAALTPVEVRELRGAKDAYRLSVCIGKGGFGAVYKARRVSDGGDVALKLLTRADADDRFWREARTMERFDDDRVVRLVETFEQDGESRTPVLAMELLRDMPGSSLKERLAAAGEGRGLPDGEVLPAFVRYAEGLAILHRAGVVHRDVKPANLYLPTGAPDRACLMDLGIVLTDRTQTVGAVPGTPDYMAPELARSDTRGDAKSDLYALGLSLYEALTGGTALPRLPTGSEAYAAWFARASSGARPDFSALDGRPEIRAVVERLSAVDPADRYGTAAEAAEALRRLSSGTEGDAETLAPAPEPPARPATENRAPDVAPAIEPAAAEPAPKRKAEVSSAKKTASHSARRPAAAPPAAGVRVVSRASGSSWWKAVVAVAVLIVLAVAFAAFREPIAAFVRQIATSGETPPLPSPEPSEPPAPRPDPVEESKKRLADATKGVDALLDGFAGRIQEVASSADAGKLGSELETLRSKGMDALNALDDAARNLPEFAAAVAAWTERCDGLARQRKEREGALALSEAKQRLEGAKAAFVARLEELSGRIGAAASEEELRKLEKEVETLRRAGRESLDALDENVRNLPEFEQSGTDWSNLCDGLPGKCVARAKELEEKWAPLLPTEEDEEKARQNPLWRRIVDAERVLADEAVPIRKGFLALRDEAEAAADPTGLKARFAVLEHAWQECAKKAVGVDGLVNRPVYGSVRDELQRVYYAARDAVDDCELRQRDRSDR